MAPHIPNAAEPLFPGPWVVGQPSWQGQGSSWGFLGLSDLHIRAQGGILAAHAPPGLGEADGEEEAAAKRQPRTWGSQEL